MRNWISACCLAAALALSPPIVVSAQTKPANATAQCKDGTYSTAKTRRGACSAHGGVGTWFGAGEATKTPAKTSGKVADNAASARPANATGQCQDGTYTTAATRRGACSGHGGVTAWFADAAPRQHSNPPPRSTGGETAPTPPPATPRPTTSTADHPANATAKCKDGTFSFAAQHRGACSHHGGVAEWYK
jgi:hypothetical protein